MFAARAEILMPRIALPIAAKLLDMPTFFADVAVVGAHKLSLVALDRQNTVTLYAKL